MLCSPAKAIGPDTPTTPPDRWKVAGTSVPKADGRAFVTGTHQYASDVRRPGMLFGRVLRPAAFRAKMTSVETKAAAALPGVTVVRDGEFVGVTAPTSHAAEAALAAIKADWQTVPQPSAADLFRHLKEKAGPGDGRPESAPPLPIEATRLWGSDHFGAALSSPGGDQDEILPLTTPGKRAAKARRKG